MNSGFEPHIPAPEADILRLVLSDWFCVACHVAVNATIAFD